MSLRVGTGSSVRSEMLREYRKTMNALYVIVLGIAM